MFLTIAGCSAPPTPCPPSLTGQYPVNTRVTCTCPGTTTTQIVTCVQLGTRATWSPPIVSCPAGNFTLILKPSNIYVGSPHDKGKIFILWMDLLAKKSYGGEKYSVLEVKYKLARCPKGHRLRFY